MHCEICGKYVQEAAHYIDGKYYHNKCILDLVDIYKNIEPRKSFYDSEMNMRRVEQVMDFVISKLSLMEILKMVREIAYDMVSYYGDDAKGIIYQSDDYDEEHRLQACKLQRLVGTACDLFGQSIIGKRKFNDDYLSQYLDGGVKDIKIAELEAKIKELEETYESD